MVHATHVQASNVSAVSDSGCGGSASLISMVVISPFITKIAQCGPSLAARFTTSGNFAALEKQGHTFATDTDTGRWLHLYEQYEESCVENWNVRLRRLGQAKTLLARDRLGVKPLFYTINNDRLAFGPN
jgi:hypothetical protein